MDSPLANHSYDVPVLGAGAAGIAAARLLARRGERVAVLEDRERAGRAMLRRGM